MFSMITLPCNHKKGEISMENTTKTARPPYHPDEQNIIGVQKVGAIQMFRNMNAPVPDIEPLYNRPITPRENLKLALSGEKPYWIPSVGWAFCDVHPFRPRMNHENIASHIICDGEEPYQYEGNVLKSYFNTEWEYVPVAGGVTTRPGTAAVTDICDWENQISFPDLDAMDWEGMAQVNKEYLSTPKARELGMAGGMWERLMYLMEVEDAAIALVDEEEKEAVKRFLDKYADWVIDYITRVKKYCDIDGVLTHDDWGHQLGGFFSLETAMEMFVPYHKRIADAIHSMGMFYELHSCGKNQELVPAYIAAGFDFWCPQAINDVEMMVEKYKDEPFWFGMPDPLITPDMSEEDIKQLANEWFKKYKDRHVFTAFMMPNPVFMSELYRLSREYYR